MTTELTLTFHSDPGHGWLEVPRSLADSLGVTPKITAYSYRSIDDKTLYLEEDCDAQTFIEAAKAAGYTYTFNEVCSTHGDSFIRRLRRVGS